MNNQQPTREQIEAAIGLIVEIGRVIQAKKIIPSGELYALVMGTLSIYEYNTAIAKLKQAGVVRERGFLLEWTGPGEIEI